MKGKENKMNTNFTIDHPVVKSFLTEQEIEPNEICETGTHSSGGGFEHFGILTDDGHVYTFNIADGWIELSYNTWNSLEDYFDDDDEKGFGCENNFPDYDEGRRWDFKVTKPQTRKERKMNLTLPTHNLTNGKYRQDGTLTEQLCVIPATDENRDAIKHINKLAKEQNSKYRLSARNRCPKKGVIYGRYGGVSDDNATGLGIYIKGVIPNRELYWKINRLENKVKSLDSENKTLYLGRKRDIETMNKQQALIDKLREEIESRKTDREKAIDHFENAYNFVADNFCEDEGVTDDVKIEMSTMLNELRKGK